ncbi:MAG: hypothetical protein ABIK99_06500 [candidate division WOR-3 bacterium]
MKYLLIIFPSILLANPFLITYFNEIQSAPDSLERIEIHDHFGGGWNLSNWQIVSSAGRAVINSGVILPPNGYVVIDRSNTTGTFSLGDEADSITLLDPRGYFADCYKYPALPASYGRGPAPPYNGSVSLYRIPDIPSRPLNWYIDSTPTFGEENDDWSSIAGRVIDELGNLVPYIFISASGPMGEISYDWEGFPINQPYYLPGLGAGKYQIKAFLVNRVWAVRQDSVDLGYNQHLTGIDIVVRYSGLGEEKISFSQRIDFYDALGRKVEKRGTLGKGIYFLPERERVKKLVIY